MANDLMLEDLRAIGVIVEVCDGCGGISCDRCPAGTTIAVNRRALSFEAAGKLSDIRAARLGVPPEKEIFLIQDRRSFAGDGVIWWRPNRGGYTQYVGQAGLYTKEEADSIHRNRETDVPVPVEVARRCVRGVVDALLLGSELKKLL